MKSKDISLLTSSSVWELLCQSRKNLFFKLQHQFDVRKVNTKETSWTRKIEAEYFIQTHNRCSQTWKKILKSSENYSLLLMPNVALVLYSSVIGRWSDFLSYFQSNWYHLSLKCSQKRSLISLLLFGHAKNNNNNKRFCRLLTSEAILLFCWFSFS